MPTTSVNQRQDYAYISSEFSTLEYKDSSNAWQIVPGIQDWDVSGTNSPTRDVIGANASAQKRVGITRVPELTFNALYLPADASWRFLREAQLDRELVRFRYTTNGERIFKSDGTGGAEVDVTTAGVLSFSDGTGQDAPTIDGSEGVGRGAVIVTPTDVAADATNQRRFIISNITAGSSPAISCLEIVGRTFVAPATAVTDEDDFAIYSPPPHRWEFVASVVQGANISLSAESEMTTTLVLAPRRPLLDPVIPNPIRLTT